MLNVYICVGVLNKLELELVQTSWNTALLPLASMAAAKKRTEGMNYSQAQGAIGGRGESGIHFLLLPTASRPAAPI